MEAREYLDLLRDLHFPATVEMKSRSRSTRI
jgi:hypothetical protein